LRYSTISNLKSFLGKVGEPREGV